MLSTSSRSQSVDMASFEDAAPLPSPSPSGADGMSVADEKKARRRTCLFIDTCGKELKLPKLPARRGAPVFRFL